MREIQGPFEQQPDLPANKVLKSYGIHHRGLKEGLELPNSFEALTQTKPGETVEMDVIQLADGNLAMIHNRDLKANEDKKISLADVENMTLSDFQGFDQSTTEGETIEGLKSPTLQETMFQLADHDAAIFLEIKATDLDRLKALIDNILSELQRLQSEDAFKQFAEAKAV